ncbi:hypothetical protein SEVIR_3G017150v4 [Setaria viridis]
MAGSMEVSPGLRDQAWGGEERMQLARSGASPTVSLRPGGAVASKLKRPGEIEHTLASWNGTGASTVQAVARGCESRSAHGGAGARFAASVPTCFAAPSEAPPRTAPTRHHRT